MTDRLHRHFQALIADTGEVLAVVQHDTGGDLTVVVSTEYAALKLFHAYRGCAHGTSGIERGPSGWNFWKRPSMAASGD